MAVGREGERGNGCEEGYTRGEEEVVGRTTIYI